MPDPDNIYKLNVTDINPDKHDGLPPSDFSPGDYDKPSPLGASSRRAFNSGKVVLKCFINDRCPFTTSNAESLLVVFNSRTLPQEIIARYFPDGLWHMVTTTPGVEGLHFTPKYVYRHTYLKNPDMSILTDASINRFPKSVREALDLSPLDVTSAAMTIDQTLYKKQQSWFMVDSPISGESPIFIRNLSVLATELGMSRAEIEADVQRTIFKNKGAPIWAYEIVNKPNNSTYEDTKNDYNENFIRDIPFFLGKNYVQMPVQINALAQNQYKLIEEEIIYGAFDPTYVDTIMTSGINPNKIASRRILSEKIYTVQDTSPVDFLPIEEDLGEDRKRVVKYTLVPFDFQGLHWKVCKDTKLFKGEDFFVEIHKKSKTPSVDDFLESLEEETEFDTVSPFKGTLAGTYAGLDVASTDTITRTQTVVDDEENETEDTYEVRKNFMLTGGENEDGEPLNTDTFNFKNQAYYIIEIGMGHPHHNYFIIICERSMPIFAHMDANGFVNILSTYPGEGLSTGVDEGERITGESLIDADYFRVTVRNHLKSLVVSFDGEGIKSRPWVINRDPSISEDSIGGAAPDKIFVPQGYLGLWGGNISAGFIFGPLQYEYPKGGVLSFDYPPYPTRPPEDENIDPRLFIANEVPFFVNVATGLNQFRGTTTAMPVSIFLDIDQSKLVDNQATDDFDMSSSPDKKRLFTQDTQFFKNYTDDIIFFGSPGFDNDCDAQPVKVSDIDMELWQVGKFFNDEPVKEISPSEGVSQDIYASSLYVCKKAEFINEDDRRRDLILQIHMGLGDHLFPSDYNEDNNIEDDEDSDGKYWLLRGCKTPILSQFRIYVPPNPESRWMHLAGDSLLPSGQAILETAQEGDRAIYGLDISNHVLMFTESWDAKDFYSIEHTGTLKLLLYPHTRNIASSEDPNKTTAISPSLLNSLTDKTFYVDIWAGYLPDESATKSVLDSEIPEGDREQERRDTLEDVEKDNWSKDPNVHTGCYSKVQGLYKLFTGLCHGGEIDVDYASSQMTCTIHDYSKILKDQIFFNSPFFDGMQDFSAITEILELAGFKTDKGWGTLSRNAEGRWDYQEDMGNAPGILIAQQSSGGYKFTTPDGREYVYQDVYGLPSAYNRLEQPSFKFADGTNFLDGIEQITKRAGRVFYFDQFGFAHFEDYLDLLINIYRGDSPFKPLFRYTTYPQYFNGQLVFNKVEHSYNVGDVFTNIKILSNSPDMNPIFMDDAKWDLVDHPSTRGFIGYPKMFYQIEPMYGSDAATKKILDFYMSVMTFPPLTIKFETFGLPVRALDIVSFNGIPARVLSVNSTIDPKENSWWQEIEVERFQYDKTLDIKAKQNAIEPEPEPTPTPEPEPTPVPEGG